MRKYVIMSLALMMMSFVFLSVQAKEGSTLTGLINVNTATPQQLMLLPGVGAAKAEALIEARTSKPFAANEDLLAVKGIGEKILANWNGLVVFEGNTTLKESVAQ